MSVNSRQSRQIIEEQLADEELFAEQCQDELLAMEMEMEYDAYYPIEYDENSVPLD